MHLSPHFTLRELTASETAMRLGIDNTPPEALLTPLRGVCENILEPVRAQFGRPYRPSSGFRCEALERAICWGGDDVKSSFARWCRRHSRPVDEISWAVYFAHKSHPKGDAVDFEVPGVANLETARWIRDNLAFDQLILEFHEPGDPASGWVHCSWVPTHRRGEVLTIGSGGTLLGLPED